MEFQWYNNKLTKNMHVHDLFFVSKPQFFGVLDGELFSLIFFCDNIIDE